jgi:hypothetical protein
VSYNIRWAEGRRDIILVELSERWTWDDMYHLTQEQIAMMATVTHRVHTIFYSNARTVQIPTNIFTNARRLMNMSHPNEDVKIFVSPPPVVKTLLQMLGKLYGLRDLVAKYWIADSMAHAYQLLDQYEKTRRAG